MKNLLDKKAKVFCMVGKLKSLNRKKIFCIVPAFNEAGKIGNVLSSLVDLNFLDKIIVVNDASRDDTEKEVKKYNVVCLSHIINRGQGAALQTGNDYAVLNGADIVVHFDADGQFDPNDIKEVILPIVKDEADIVFGSRFMGKKSNMPLLKEKVITPLAHLVNKIFIGKTLSDPQSGFRAMNIRSVKTINIQNDKMAHCSEIIYKAFENKFRITEVPITVFYDNFGQNIFGGVRIIFDLFLSRLIN